MPTINASSAPATPAVRVYDATPLKRRLDEILGDPNIPIEDVPRLSNEALFTTKLDVARQSGQGPTGDAVIDGVFENVTKVDGYLRTQLGRDGWDGHGGTLEVKAHFPSDNANWEYQDDSFWVGDSGAGVSLGTSLDVAAHEIAHGMYKSEVYASDAEADAAKPTVWNRAVDESFADVFATQVDPDDWTVGEDVHDPNILRDLEHPKYASLAEVPMDRVIDPNAGASSRIGKGGAAPVGEHDLSGIPSLAAVHAAAAIGRADMGRVWYRALTEHLRADDDFPGAARATVAAATDLFGAGATQTAAVRDAWASVGVTS